VDGDGDGVSACGGDCDDANPAVFPGNLEVCDGVDNDCDPLTLDDPDSDGDGFGACTGDCDDANPAAFPGNVEQACDGVDNDCDPYTLDNDDLDGDGVFACDGDCDDDDGGRYPGNGEVCDGLDNDCNGAIDDGIPGEEWYADVDGDGFGDPLDTLSTCDGLPPSGYVADDSDCDDGDLTVNPDAVEVPCDGLDNDCDPSTIDAAPDGDGDGVGACEDCDDADAAVFPGAVEVCNGVDNDCNGIPDDGIPVLAYWPDVDGDGFGDALAEAEVTCDPQVGWVADGTDCDDAEVEINPGVDELPCDGLDNDCDPLTLDVDSSCDTGVTSSEGRDFTEDTALSLQGSKIDDAESGCSCDASSGQSSGVWLVLGGLLWGRRRRSR